MKKIAILINIALFFFVMAIAAFTMFFDEAVLVRKGTLYHVNSSNKVVALTFDDGPSPIWTPKILAELKRLKVKATFFMLGEHVERYPEVAKQVAIDGHDIGNHSFSHHVLIYYKMEELEKEILSAQDTIKRITGKTTRFFRPPKAWLRSAEKKKIKDLGYEVILWSLNSKDWVRFNHKYILKFILQRVQPGDIILFHDSGGVFTAEGSDRSETVKVLPLLIEKLRERGFRFVTVTELLELAKRHGN